MIVEVLREMQYQRLSATPEVRRMQRLADLPGIDFSATVNYSDILSREINRRIVYALRQIVAMGRADLQELNQLRWLTSERLLLLKQDFPSLISEIEALGLMPYIEQMAAEPTEGQRAPSANISESVVSAGEIKSTGKSVSIDDVLNRIDKVLEDNDEPNPTRL